MATLRRVALLCCFVALGLGASLLTASPAAASCTPQRYLASICITAATYCPAGYLDASGQLLQINQNQNLFALTGTAHGGDGRKTFALPKLNGNAPPSFKGLRFCIAVQGTYPPQS